MHLHYGLLFALTVVIKMHFRVPIHKVVLLDFVYPACACLVILNFHFPCQAAAKGKVRRTINVGKCLCTHNN